MVPVKSEANKYKRLDYCFYCKKGLRSRISKHYVSRHKQEPRVDMAINSTGKGKASRLYALQQLGNFKHNCEVRCAAPV